jgi:uncharacterized membrane protein
VHALLLTALAQGDAPAPVYSERTFKFLALPELWVVGLVMVPAVIAFAWWSYGGLARLERRTRIILSVIRGLTLAACLLALFQPAFETVRYSTQRTQVHVLVDDSASMQRRDSYPDAGENSKLAAAAGVAELASHTRTELVAKVLERPGGLLELLRQNHDVRLFRFSRRPQPVNQLAELTARGPRTAIGDALDLQLALAGSVNLDAVILVSDGRSNAGSPPVEVARKYRGNDTPIYTLGVGDPNPPRNVRLVGPPGPREALRLEEVAFDLSLSAEGSLEGRSVTVTMSGARDGGQPLPLATAQATLAGPGEPVKVRLYHAFEEAGDYALHFQATPLPEETTVEDNSDTRFLRVNDEKILVLIVDDIPRYEYYYAKVALLRVDPSIAVQSYQFDASKDFPQERSEGLPPLEDIPRTREEMFKYHAIILGDIPPERIAPTEEGVQAWLQLLVDFVEFGGGVAFCWGQEAMPERYRGTPLEDLLPVVLNDPDQQVEVDMREDFWPRLESPTTPHDIVLLRREPKSNEDLWQRGFAPICGYYPVQQAKAGAHVLLRHPTAGNRFGKHPLLVAGFYPRGRTLFSAIDQTWKWRKHYGEKYHDPFWRNVVRYLAGSRLRRQNDFLELRVDKVIVETGDQVRVTLRLLDLEVAPQRGGEYAIFLRRADGPVERQALSAVSGEDGVFEGRFTLLDPGTVSLLVFADDNPSGEVLAREDVLVKIPDKEMADSSQDRDTLEKVAGASKGGFYAFLADAGQLADVFKERKPYESEVDRSTRPAWDAWWTLAGILALLTVEWLLRKRARLV